MDNNNKVEIESDDSGLDRSLEFQALDLYMERLDPGKTFDLAALCKERPDLAEHLEHLHLRWNNHLASCKDLGGEDEATSGTKKLEGERAATADQRSPGNRRNPDAGSHSFVDRLESRYGKGTHPDISLSGPPPASNGTPPASNGTPHALKGTPPAFSETPPPFSETSPPFSETSPEEDQGTVNRIMTQLSAHAPKLNRYKTLEEVARGGMGAILKVWDGDLRRNLAMKVILTPKDNSNSMAAGSSEELSLMRFLEEAQVTGQLDHPGIVPVHELGLDDDGKVFFTMRLVHGRDLRKIFDLVKEEKEGWNRTRALGVLLKVCEAMAFAHAKGVIHRDLKPGNIMVGRFGEVYVMDWGLAKVLGRDDGRDLRIRDPGADSGSDSSTDSGSAGDRSGKGGVDPGVGFQVDPGADRDDDHETAALKPVSTDRTEERGSDAFTPLLTMDGDVIGTPAYMSPEQARGELERMDRRADVYALGAMLYHLLTDRMPYTKPEVGVDGCTVWRWLLEGPPTPVHEIAPDAPSELEAICEKAMARDRSDRYADMEEVAEDLRAYLENRVVKAHRTGPIVEIRKWVRRNRALAYTISLAFVLLLGGSIAASLVLAAKNREITQARDRAEVAASQAEAINDFLVDEMLLASTPEAAMGREITVKEVLDKAAEKVEASLGGKEQVEASVLHTLGNAYWRLGRHEEAARHLEGAYKIRQEVLGDMHRDTLTTQSHLGWTRFFEGRIQDGEEMLRDNHRRRLEAFGPHDRDTLHAVDALGDMVCNLGNPEEAETMLRENLELRRKIMGEDHKTTLGTQHKLAQAVQQQGKLDEAVALAEDLVERRRRTLTENHPDTVIAINDLASYYHDLGRMEEAEQHYREGLEATRKVYGEGHFMYSVALNNLATSYQDRGRYENRPELYEEAEKLLRRSLEVRQAVFKEDHPLVATAYHNLAGALHSRGESGEAESLVRKALEIRKASFGMDHEETINTLYGLAVVQRSIGKEEASEANFREAIEMADLGLPEGHWRKGAFRKGLGQLYVKQKKYAEAEEVLLEAHRILEGTLGGKHFNTKGLVEELIQLYKAWGKKEEAALWKDRRSG